MKLGGQTVVLIAIVASIAAHVGIMAYMRPHVLAEYAEAIRLGTRRAASEMRALKVPPKAVRLDTAKDLAPLRAAPDASSEALLPADSSLEAAEPEGWTPPIPADPGKMLSPQPVVEVAPKMSETVASTPDDVPSFVAKLADTESIGLSMPSDPPPDAPDMLVAADLPAVAPPPAVKMYNPGDSAVPPPAIVDEAAGKDAFAPPVEVMKELDESVVAAEKAAVRDLLDVRDAKVLEKAVAVGADSAAAGDWVYFRMKIDPLANLKVVPKDVVILMDASGSIANDRLKSCRAAAREILRSCLNTDDRFNLVAFRDKFQYAFKTWRPCNAMTYAAADAWMDKLAAHGRTDVFKTISSVLKLPRDPSRPLIALVVTDGDANSGVSATASILSRFTALNDGLVSVYMYGVKESANRELIDLLTRGNRGESFIYEGERKFAGRKIEDLSERFRDPVLSDIRVVFTTGSKAEAYPRRLKNLYKGETLEIVGRVPAGASEVSFSLKGLNGANAYEGFFRVSLSQATFDPNLPAAWQAEQAIDSRLR